MFGFDSLKKSKSIALLLDPDKTILDPDWIEVINLAKPDLILIGGSQPFSFTLLDDMVTYLKKHSKIPLIGFPGDTSQLHSSFDGLLALSVVQSSDANFILAPLFHSARFIEQHSLPAYYTPYLILDGKGMTSVEKVLEGKIKQIDNLSGLDTFLFGLKVMRPTCIYLEAGSGAQNILKLEYIERTKNRLMDSYLFAGGGVRNITQILALWIAGADCVVVGNWLEKEKQALIKICKERDIMNGH